MAHWIEGKGWSDNHTPRVCPTPSTLTLQQINDCEKKRKKSSVRRIADLAPASITDFVNQYGEGRGYEYLRDHGLEFSHGDLLRIVKELILAINHGKICNDFAALDVEFMDCLAEFAEQKGEFD